MGETNFKYSEKYFFAEITNRHTFGRRCFAVFSWKTHLQFTLKCNTTSVRLSHRRACERDSPSLTWRHVKPTLLSVKHGKGIFAFIWGTIHALYQLDITCFMALTWPGAWSKVTCYRSIYMYIFIIHQIFSLARDWSKRVTWANIPQLKLGNIRGYSPILKPMDNKHNSLNLAAKICSDICPWTLSVPRKLTVFLELRSWKTVRFSEQIMSDEIHVLKLRIEKYL